MKQRTESKNPESFHTIFKRKADEFAFGVYKISRTFPREEVYGLTSQLRRAALSVVLNCIEGYARNGDRQYKNFLQIAYGSLKEAKYLLFFAQREGYIHEEAYQKLLGLAEEIGAMLWKTIQEIKDKE